MEGPAHRRTDGRSAQRRACERWGMAAGRAAVLDDDPELARRLAHHLRHLPVVVLHDRRLSEDGSVIDHLAIGPGGMTVIATAGEAALPGGLAPTPAVLAVRRQVLTLRRLVHDRVAVLGVLCPREGTSPAPSVAVHGVVIGDAAAAARVAAREGSLADDAVAALVQRLDAALTPVLDRRRGAASGPSPA